MKPESLLGKYMLLPKIIEGIKEITSQFMDKVIPNEALQTSEQFIMFHIFYF